MIILGAGGHSIEVLDILIEEIPKNEIVFFDNTIKENNLLFNEFTIHNSLNSISTSQTNFVLGIGGIHLRRKLTLLALKNKLKYTGIRSKSASIGKFQNTIDSTVDIMKNVTISSSVIIGKGTLLNRNVNIHHDVVIGDFCELAPGCQVLGNVNVGCNVFIGAGAIILPNIKVEDNAIIGAGSIVTKNVAANITVIGNPAKKISNE